MNSHNESNRITINICKNTLTITKCFYVNYFLKKLNLTGHLCIANANPEQIMFIAFFFFFRKENPMMVSIKVQQLFSTKKGKQLQVCLRKIKLPRMMGWTDKITQWGCYENRKHWFFWAGAWAPILREHLMLPVSGWKHAGAEMQGGLWLPHLRGHLPKACGRWFSCLWNG